MVEEGVPKARAAKLCGVPRSTLLDKLSGRSSIYAKLGAKRVLMEEEEERLVQNIFRATVKKE